MDAFVGNIEFVRSLDFLTRGRQKRLIVAGTYLRDGRIAFVDRKNSELLVAQQDSATFKAFGFGNPFPKDTKTQPSDANKGIQNDELLVTFTHELHSSVVLYRLNDQLVKVRFFDLGFRTRTVACIGAQHFIASAELFVHVLDASGKDVVSHPRQTRDRGGLVTSDNGRFYYGDGREFVCCRFTGSNIVELFRFKNRRMNFPRGSALDRCGNILVCCDVSNNVFQISPEPRNQMHRIVIQSGHNASGFGDIDIHPNGREMFTTFWRENQWPEIYRLT